MRNPNITNALLQEMRVSIHDYVSKSHEAVKTYGAVLDIAEPLGIVSEGLPFQAAKPKQLTLREPVSETTRPETLAEIELDGQLWPFPNHASFSLAPDQLAFSQKEEPHHP